MRNNIEIEWQDGTRATWVNLTNEQMDAIAEHIESVYRNADTVTG